MEAVVGGCESDCESGGARETHRERETERGRERHTEGERDT